jgi:hypothetical protein
MQFEVLSENLLKCGIAPQYVRRYLTELSEHLEDLTAEQRVAGFDPEDAAIRARARLGSDDELAGAMLAHKDFRSWAARAPLAVFGLLPPLVALLGGFTVLAPLVLCARETGMVTHGGINAPQWFRTSAAIACAVGNFAIAPSVALGFALLAKRQRLRDLWPLLAILVIALLDLQFQATFPMLGHRGGALGINGGLWLFHLHGFSETWRLAATQLVLTLLPAFWLFHRRLVKR